MVTEREYNTNGHRDTEDETLAGSVTARLADRKDGRLRVSVALWPVCTLNRIPQVEREREFQVTFLNRNVHGAGCVAGVEKSGEAAALRLISIDRKRLKAAPTGMDDMVGTPPAAST